MQHVALRRTRDHVLDQVAGKAQPAIGAKAAALRHRDLDDLLGRLRHAEFGQHVERGAMNALEVVVAERAVLAAGQPGSHGGRLVAAGFVTASAAGTTRRAHGDARRDPARHPGAAIQGHGSGHDRSID